MAAGPFSRRVAPMYQGGKYGVVVANRLAATAADRVPLCRDNDRGLHMPCRPNDKSYLGFARKLIV